MIFKICGITNQEDASAAIDAGATAVGLNFYPRSPRYIAPERAAEIATAAGVRRVGVFVNERPARVEEVARIARLDVAQLHGDELPAEFPASLPVWKGLRMSEMRDISIYDEYPVEALLLDGPASGISFDWTVAKHLPGRPHRIVLAGGLDSLNVAEAIAIVRPWGVDVCSRIESAPGRKDHKKMTAFLHAARLAAL